MARVALALATVCAFLAIPSLVRCQEHCHNNCKCEDESINCRNVSNIEEMEKIMISVREKSVKAKKFYLADTMLPALPEDLFRGTELEKLDFVNVQLPYIVPPIKELSPFAGLETLEEIRFRNVSYLYNWNWTMFTNVNELAKIDMKDSLFIYVSKNFSHMKSSRLKHLHLVNCKIRRIEDRAFSTFSYISNLVLTDNAISSFPRTILPLDAANLVKIDLKNNKLETLDSNFFSGMPALSYVSVMNNNLQRLSDSLRIGVTNGFSFYVDDNPFVCDCDLHWICQRRDDNIRVDYGKTICSDPTNFPVESLCKKKCP